MQPVYYIGLDAHKRIISYCVKDNSGKIHSEGSLPSTRSDRSMKTPRTRESPVTDVYTSLEIASESM
jgi:hypothetical protein